MESFKLIKSENVLIKPLPVVKPVHDIKSSVCIKPKY